MSEIDWSRLRSTTVREIISALERDGFSLRNQSGSHQRYRLPVWRETPSILNRALSCAARLNVAEYFNGNRYV